MISKDWTLGGLAVELSMDRRAMARALEGLQPAHEKTKGKRTERYFKMVDVISHIYKSGSNHLDLNQERARLALLQQEKLTLEIAELRGQLIRVPLVEEQWAEAFASMRAKLLALPAKLAIAVAQPDRIQQAQDKSQALIYEALSELSEGDADADAAVGDGASTHSAETAVDPIN
jgi:hypothetical protein